jgi:GNAT superfamily N-acetyltransferase
VAAGAAFRSVGMVAVADDPPPPVLALRGFVDRGRAWVAEESGTVAAYLLADVVDGGGHVEQVSVDPAFARRGLGRALVEHAAAWARDAGHAALTLTTYRDVPWNGPYYVRLGFRPLDDDALGPGLRAIRRAETARGLDRHGPRLAMRREL